MKFLGREGEERGNREIRMSRVGVGSEGVARGSEEGSMGRGSKGEEI